MIAVPQPNHYVGSFTRHCFRNGAPDGMFPVDYNDLLSYKIEGRKSALCFLMQSLILIENLLT